MIRLTAGRRRLLGVGLTAYGLLGLAAALFVVAAALALGPTLDDTVERLDRQRQVLVATLGSSASALERTAVLADDAAGALASSGEISAEAANVSRRLADTLARLAGTFESVSIIGNEPFAPLAADARQLAEQLRGIALDLDSLGIRMARIGRGVPPLADDLQATGTQLATLAADLDDLAVAESATAGVRWLALGLVVLVAWLVVPALIAVGTGVALLRRAGHRAA